MVAPIFNVKSIWGSFDSIFESCTKVWVTTSSFGLHVLWIMLLYNLKWDIFAWLISCCSNLKAGVFSLPSTSAALLREVTLGKSLRQQFQITRYLDGSKQVIIAFRKLLFSFMVVFHFFFSYFIVSSDKDRHMNNLFGARTVSRVNLQQRFNHGRQIWGKCWRYLRIDPLKYFLKQSFHIWGLEWGA